MKIDRRGRSAGWSAAGHQWLFASWGGEAAYFKEIILKLRAGGYNVRGAIADTIGCAWAVARFGHPPPIVAPGGQKGRLLSMSPPALRLDQHSLARLRKLGFARIDMIVRQPRSSLTPRFGRQLLQRLDQALGDEAEFIIPVIPPVPFQERLPCLEPIVTLGGLEYALLRLLEILCRRLQAEGKGIQTAIFVQCALNLNPLLSQLTPDQQADVPILSLSRADEKDGTPFPDSLKKPLHPSQGAATMPGGRNFK